ncbi:DNA-binding LacI/PurR family transcriptional regulator [Streptomyces sp. V4I8]
MTPVGGQGGSPAAPRAVDVAQRAGVSQKTVSRVFNGERYVSDDVRRRVLEAAEELGYRLNSAARALASGRTRTIGVVTLGTALYGPASLLIGIERAARDARATRSGCTTRWRATRKASPGPWSPCSNRAWTGSSYPNRSTRERRETTDPSPSASTCRSSSSVPATFGGPRAVAVGGGAESPARAATEHLLDLGHVTVHHLAGPQRWFAARDRLEGWRAALSARGRQQPLVLKGDWTAASGYAAGRELASAGDVTAVFAANDDMAIGLIRALTEAGLRVPGDVSVVGFDDIPVSAYVTPPLTTMRQPFDAVAREGLRLLVQAIEKPDAEPEPVNDPPVELVVRASTAPPAENASAGGRRSASPSPD